MKRQSSTSSVWNLCTTLLKKSEIEIERSQQFLGQKAGYESAGWVDRCKRLPVRSTWCLLIFPDSSSRFLIWRKSVDWMRRKPVAAVRLCEPQRRQQTSSPRPTSKRSKSLTLRSEKNSSNALQRPAMRINDVVGQLVATYTEWNHVLANPRFVRKGRTIT